MHGTSGIPFPLTTYNGLVTLARPEALPEGASPRTYDTDFPVGGVRTRDGLRSVYSFANSSVTRLPSTAESFGSGVEWTNPQGVEGDTSFASVQLAAASPSSAVLAATEYTFTLTAPITGLAAAATGYGSGVTLTAQLVLDGSPIGTPKTFTLPATPGPIALGAGNDTWGVFPLTDSDLDNNSFGIQITAQLASGQTSGSAYLQNVSLSAWFAPNATNFQFITTFVAQDGTVRNLLLDASGNLYVENVTTDPYVLTQALSGIAAGAQCVASNGPDVEYMAFGNGTQGIDLPLQYTASWIDRITQVGPGRAPVFTPLQSSGNSFAVVEITQPAAKSQGYSYFLQSAGPGSNTPGNVITFYYLDATVAPGPDEDLVSAVNSGYPVYAYVSFTGTPEPFGPQVVLITGVGEAQPPGQPRNFYYFTFQVASVAYTYYPGSGEPGYTANYQRSLATLTTSLPVPNLGVGGQMAVTGNSVAAWNNTWKVTETPNASSMAITQSSLTAGVATFSYDVTNGTQPPAAGEMVTISGTLNAGGALNVTNWPVATASGGNSGTFTVNGFEATVNYPAESEDGLATTAGTVFEFDPGAALLGTGTNPIYGTGTGGSLIFNTSGLFIDPGTYQGTAFFITRNGYWSCPAPPVTFTIPENTTQLLVSSLPVGPPNVVQRGIALTEAGQNGVPGASFFTLPTPVSFYSNGVKYTATQFLVDDNVSTTTTLFFTGAILDSAEAIDVYGYNLFNQIEIGSPGWLLSYADRNFYGMCLNKVQNFINLSFDGGYLPNVTGKNVPLGWTQPDAFGSLVVSPKFGNAYYILNSGLTLAITGTSSSGGVATYTYTVAGSNNPSAGDPVTVTGTTNGGGAFNLTGTIASVDVSAGTFTVNVTFGNYASQAETGQAVVQGTLPQAGLISQGAYQDWEEVPILESNTLYSVRVTARCPSGLTTGSLLISLTNAGVTLGSFSLPFASMTQVDATFTGTLLTSNLSPVPAGLTLNVSAVNIGKGADVEIDRIDVFPTAIPVLATTVYGSYAGLPEQVDSVTGQVIVASENQQPVSGGRVLYDTLYLFKGDLTGTSLYSLQASSSLEPADWAEPEVAQRSGAIGPLAFDFGEQWIVMANRNGIYLFEGGQPGKIMHEIFQVWEAINWNAASSIWVRNDVNRRRLLVGVPLPTPNFWLPNAPVNSAPTSPNVILMLNYRGLDTGEQIRSSPGMHTTMFGKLAALDMRRKWSLWQIACPYAALVRTPDDLEFYFCNGIGSGKVYAMDESMVTDDGAPIDSLYTTAGLPDMAKRAEMPQLGPNRVRWGYFQAALQSAGTVNVTLYPNWLLGPGETPNYNAWTIPGGFSPGNPALNDVEASLNFPASRTFVEFRENDGLGSFVLSNLLMSATKDVWNTRIGGKTAAGT